MSTKVEISKRLVLINSASSVATRLINILVLLWLHQYLLSRISPEEYSIYPVLMAVMVFVPLLTVILRSGIGRYIVEAYAKGDERQITQIVSTMFPLLMGAGVLVLALGWTFAWHVGRILTIAPDRLWDARIMMTLLIFSAVIQLPLAPFGVGMYVRQKFVLSNCIGLCIQILRIALLFILLLGISTRVLWVVVASESANICGLAVTVAISHRLVPALKFRLDEIRWSMAKTLTSFGAWNFVLSAADMIRNGADAIILNKLGTSLDVTNFHLGSMAFRQIQSGSYLVRAPLQPPLTAMHATGEDERLRNTYLRGGRYALWVSIFVSLPLIIYRKEIITLYVGDKFLTAGTVMALLMVVFPIAYGNIMMPHIARAKAIIGPWAIRAAVMHSTNLCLTLYLVGRLRMGAIGSALATFLVSNIGHILLMWPLGLRLAGANFSRCLRETIWPGFLPGLAGVVIWMWLKRLVEPSDWVTLGVCTGIGWLLYVSVLFLFCLQASDKRELLTFGARLKALFTRKRNNGCD